MRGSRERKDRARLARKVAVTPGGWGQGGGAETANLTWIRLGHTRVGGRISASPTNYSAVGMLPNRARSKGSVPRTRQKQPWKTSMTYLKNCLWSLTAQPGPKS